MKNHATSVVSTEHTTLGLNAATVLTLDNVTAGDADAGNIKAAYAAGITSSTIVLNKAGDAATSGSALDIDIDGTGVKTLNVTTAGAASRVVLDGTAEAIETLNITGDQNLTATIFDTSATKLIINAAAFTGTLNLDLKATEVFEVTGGTGDDRALFAGTDDFFAGGLGVNTLAHASISDAVTTLNSKTAAGVFKSSNIQTVEFVGSGTAVNASVDASAITLASVVNYKFTTTALGTGSGTAAVSGAAGTSGITGSAGTDAMSITGQKNNQMFVFETAVTGQNGGAGGAATVTGSDGGSGGKGGDGLEFASAVNNAENSLSLVLSGVKITGGTGGAGGATSAASNGGTGGKGGAAGNGLVLTGYEFINISSTGTSSTAVNEFSAGAGGAGGALNGTGTSGAGGDSGNSIVTAVNSKFVITGANELKMGTISSSGSVLVDASALTGKLTVTTGDAADTIKGGSSNNTITLTGGADTVDLTKSVAKADVITTTAATNTTSTAFVSITGFTNSATATIGDKLDVIGTAAIQANVASGTATTVTNMTAGVLNGIMTFAGTAAASATLADKVASATLAAFAGAQNETLAFEHSGSTFVFVQADANANVFNNAGDQLIELVGLVGVNALSTAASAENTIFVV